MPTQAFSPAVPHNPRNYMVPSRISAIFRSICPDGSLDLPVNFGSISDIEFTPSETALELKSAFKGANSVDRRLITDVSGTVSLQIHELAGTNVNLLFRSASAENRNVAGGNPVTVYGTSTINLVGTTPVEVDPNAVEYDVVNNLVLKQPLTIIRVESAAMVDAATGRGTQYLDVVDYVQASGGTGVLQALTFSGASTGAPVPGGVVTGSAWLQYAATSGTVVPIATHNISSALRIAYTGGTGSVPVVGEIINDGTNDFNVLFVEAGATGAAGFFHAINTTGATLLTANAALGGTGDRGFNATLVAGVTDADVINNVSASSTAAAGTLFFHSTGLTSTNGAFQIGAPFLINTGAGYTAGAAKIGTISDLQVALPTGTLQSVQVTNSNFAGGVGAGILVVGSATGTFRVGDINLIQAANMTDAVISSVSSSGATTGTTLARSGSSGIPDGSAVTVTYSYERDGYAYSMMDGIVLEGELTIQVLSVDGPQSIYRFFRVNLYQEGAISINPEERVQPTLQATILPRLSDGRRGEFILLAGFGSFSLTNCA